MIFTTYPYHVVLVPKKKKKKQKKTTNVGQITRGELKRRIPDGDTKYLLGTIV
jgi:hypothetical protein